MLVDYLISVSIGFLGAVIVISIWVVIEFMMLRYRCGKSVETVILSLKDNGKTKLLPWHSTKEFLEGVEPLQNRIRTLKQIVSISNFKIKMMKHAEDTLKIIVAFNVLHQDGNSFGQAVVYRKPSGLRIQQLIIE